MSEVTRKRLEAGIVPMGHNKGLQTFGCPECGRALGDGYSCPACIDSGRGYFMAVEVMKYGRHGLRMFPSTHFPGEWVCACSACLSTNLTDTSRFTGLGTGPMGRHRFGDRAVSFTRCEDCGSTFED